MDYTQIVGIIPYSWKHSKSTILLSHLGTVIIITGKIPLSQFNNLLAI